jgi:hypothetical protein
MPLFGKTAKVKPEGPAPDPVMLKDAPGQFPIGDDASTVIQDQTRWTNEVLKNEKVMAARRPKLLERLGDIATKEDKAYSLQSKRIIELIDAELKRRGVEGGRRRKTRGRKTRGRKTRHRRRTSRR